MKSGEEEPEKGRCPWPAICNFNEKISKPDFPAHFEKGNATEDQANILKVFQILLVLSS